MAKKFHPDTQPADVSEAQKETARLEFINLTAEFEERMKALSSDAGTEMNTEADVRVTLDDSMALEVFMGVAADIDPLLASQLRSGMRDALAAAGGQPAGLDRGGWWAAAAMLGAEGMSGNKEPSLLESQTRKPALGRKPRRRKS